MLPVLRKFSNLLACAILHRLDNNAKAYRDYFIRIDTLNRNLRHALIAPNTVHPMISDYDERVSEYL